MFFDNYEIGGMVGMGIDQLDMLHFVEVAGDDNK